MLRKAQLAVSLAAGVLACSGGKGCLGGSGKFSFHGTITTGSGTGTGATPPNTTPSSSGGSSSGSPGNTVAMPDWTTLPPPPADRTAPEYKEFLDDYNQMMKQQAASGAWVSSLVSGVTSTPGYHAMVSMGHKVLPYVFLEMWRGPPDAWDLNLVAQQITGIDMRANSEWNIEMGEEGLEFYWVKWWEKNYNDPKWK